MIEHEINEDYFEYLYDLMCGSRYSKNTSYRKLLWHLYQIDFRYVIPKDRNRAKDGVSLRRSFAVDQGCGEEPELITDYLSYPCSVLEMISALAIRCENDIMDDPKIGDRTGQWFWGMINNLGLSGMTDNRYDEAYIDEVIERFLDRDYSPNGKGGLFTIRNCEYDLREVEIWYQLCWYLDTIA